MADHARRARPAGASSSEQYARLTPHAILSRVARVFRAGYVQGCIHAAILAGKFGSVRGEDGRGACCCFLGAMKGGVLEQRPAKEGCGKHTYIAHFASGFDPVATGASVDVEWETFEHADKRRHLVVARTVR